jgi:MFS family permease
MNSRGTAAALAWLLTAIYYFYQYTLRTAPSVMMPQLSAGFGLGSLGLASLVGCFYYGYAPFSLVAGSALDRMGARSVLPTGALLTAFGAVLFATGNVGVANLGRFLQGAGGVFALVGAVYIASKNFPANRAASLIGATQMFGMAGGSAGQFLVARIIARGIPWQGFWIAMSVIGVALAAMLYLIIPPEPRVKRHDRAIATTLQSLGKVFSNPQTILCGIVAGIMFIPTTILSMTWGVKFLQEAHGFNYGEAVLRSATVPLGWIIGCPLLGALSDWLGRRKPVIVGGVAVLLACVAWALYGDPGMFPPYLVGLVAGLASGAAMLPYTIVKEIHPRELGGTATGAVNFVIFSLSALLGPAFAQIMQRVSGGTEAELQDYQLTFQPMVYGLGLAMLLALFLKETGPAVARTAANSPKERIGFAHDYRHREV